MQRYQTGEAPCSRTEVSRLCLGTRRGEAHEASCTSPFSLCSQRPAVSRDLSLLFCRDLGCSLARQRGPQLQPPMELLLALNPLRVPYLK